MARITIVHDVAGVAAEEARLLRAAGHEVTHIRLPQPGANWRWPVKAIAILWRLVIYLPAVVRIRLSRPDVLHIHWVLMGVLGVLAGRPFHVSAHGSDLHVHFRGRVLRVLSRFVLGRAERIFYSTPNLATYLTGFEDKSVHLPNPVDPADFPIRERPAGRAVLLFTRLDPIKGVDVVFAAAERLVASAELTGLAWGPLRADYLSRYGGVVRFVEPVGREQIPEFLQDFDVVVGQMKQGTLGLAEIEALAAGLPVVTGLDLALYAADPPPVTCANDADGIVAAVERLLADPAGRPARRLAARSWVERNHGSAHHLQILEEAYGLRHAV